jgi:hypothetical protein
VYPFNLCKEVSSGHGVSAELFFAQGWPRPVPLPPPPLTPPPSLQPFLSISMNVPYCFSQDAAKEKKIMLFSVCHQGWVDVFIRNNLGYFFLFFYLELFTVYKIFHFR